MSAQRDSQLSAAAPRPAEQDPLTQIFARTFTVSSADGLVTVTADGQPSLKYVAVAELDDMLFDPMARHSLSESSTVAVSQCIATARQATVQAMAQLPGLNPQLRALLLGGS